MTYRKKASLPHTLYTYRARAFVRVRGCHARVNRKPATEKALRKPCKHPPPQKKNSIKRELK